MAKRLQTPNGYGGTTDHSEEIVELRQMAQNNKDDRETFVMINLAADLLEAHDQTGISLDDWPYARQFVETMIGPILPNLV